MKQMTAFEYFELSSRTCKEFPFGLSLTRSLTDILHATLGISGEAGELLDAVKKTVIYNKELDLINVREELGDILWYVALACRACNFTLEELMQSNIEKLRVRYPDIYSDADAIARADKIGDPV